MTAPLLDVLLNGTSVASVNVDDVPCELEPSARITAGDVVEFVASDGMRHAHRFDVESGWAHFSIRVHPGFACQADCAVTDGPDYDKEAAARSGRWVGIRFQPVLLPGATGTNSGFHGHGLFRRGLHFSGTVTQGNVSLGCICDACGEGFRIQSFHAGLSQVGYFYSSSGAHTLIVDEHVPGCPPPLGVPDIEQLSKLESTLPPAPDGSTYRYSHPFRCPHCSAPYIDFGRFPEERRSEYYGNTHFTKSPIRHVPEPER